jgi:hypothetical protein
MAAITQLVYIGWREPYLSGSAILYLCFLLTITAIIATGNSYYYIHRLPPNIHSILFSFTAPRIINLFARLFVFLFVVANVSAHRNL